MVLVIMAATVVMVNLPIISGILVFLNLTKKRTIKIKVIKFACNIAL